MSRMVHLLGRPHLDGAATRYRLRSRKSWALLAYLLLGESLHDYDLLGAAFIVAGVVLATVIKPRAVPAKA